MDVSLESDWKKGLGFPVNFTSDQSSDDDPDSADVVMRRPPRSRRSTDYLLADAGDGSEADLLSSTPPRERIRIKGKTGRGAFPGLQKTMRDRRNTTVYASATDNAVIPERLKKRWSLKRSTDREWKHEMGQRENKADSLPSPETDTPAVPTLVESCSRFMSLTSRLKCRASRTERAEQRPPAEQLPDSRVTFHQTFSMLITMGNADKTCRRAISREEQVWQNEFKDLIWLELQAKIAGRTLAQQDAFLCTQRNIIPTLIKNIIDYRFVNPNPCKGRSQRLCAAEGSREDLNKVDQDEKNDTEDSTLGCLSFDCRLCSEAIGAAMTEVRILLDSFHRASALYPSTQAMTGDHPLLATSLFQNRIKAMCLWYNMAMHMRMKLLAVRRLLRTIGSKDKSCRIPDFPCLGHGSERDVDQSCSQRHVRFNVSGNPTDSSNSDASSHSEKNQSESDKELPDQSAGGKDCANQSGDSAAGGSHVKDKDETDCVFRAEQNGQTTPEIIISDAKYSTSDTTASSESGYASERDRCYLDETVFNLGSLADLTRLRLLQKCDVSPYRAYHYEILKTKGVRRCMMFIHKLRKKLLSKVYLTFLPPDSEPSDNEGEEEPAEASGSRDDKSQKAKEAQDDYELRRFGCWSPECLAMGLPAGRSHFLLLGGIGMEVVHDYLSMRLAGRPERPSCLTVKQLIHELKEGLDIATKMRQAFVRHIEAALRGHRAGAAARQDLLLVISTFDASVEDVFKQYLSYLTKISAQEHMGRASLEAEWAFVARVAARGAWAPHLAPEAFTEIACNQLDRVRTQFEKKFQALHQVEKNSPDPSRHVFYTMCREAQNVFAGEREAALQAAAGARALAAQLARAGPHAGTARQRIYESLMSFRECIVRQTMVILERASVAPPDEFLHEVTDGVVARVRDLLLQVYRLGFELHKECYTFVHGASRPAPQRQRPASLQPARPVVQRLRRPETMLVHDSVNPLIHKELHRFMNDRYGAACGRRASQAAGGRARAGRAGPGAEGDEGRDQAFPDVAGLAEAQSQVSIVELLTGSPPPPPPAPPPRAAAAEQAWGAAVARAVVAFARCWMRFVMERCERGRGRRPRWASQGLEFLMLACDPHNTRHLSEDEFEELKHLMDACISHVVGSRAAAPRAAEPEPAAPRPRRRLQSPLPAGAGAGAGPGAPAPPTPPCEPQPVLNFSAEEPSAHTRSVLEAIRKLDLSRDAALREMKAVGRVAAPAVASYEPRMRQVTFKWQRGLKIGAGTFGKVYTVVNTETGQLLAMKELSIGAGDRRATQRAANELRVLEGAQHPHLVRYYGIEVHREEMLIFMELCVEGSLEALVATSGPLPEQTVRRYTRQLLSAVAELHDRNIAHRDIKSGNIFLTNEGHCLKLGDFGCAVKIRSTTTAAGELQGYVGTQAYMAPEVFMKSSGHGRATDIWSLGCVVTEMASGKRPFSEYDSNYQIMFVVGMGGRPAVPDALSDEGRQFCLSCLTHDPDQRPKAQELSLHHFLMVKDDDCHDCKPGTFL